jgi:hypothetical protein
MSTQTLPNPFDASVPVDSYTLDGLERELSRPPVLLPPNCPPFYPLVHHDISGEIPAHRVLPVRVMFIAALSFSVALVFSFFTAWFAGSIESESRLNSFHVGKELFFSLFYVVLYVPLIFYVQYWPFYCANRDEKPCQHAQFIQLFVIIVMAIFFLGVPGTGMVGIVYVFSAFHDGEPVNQALSGIATIWHACNLVVECLLWLLIENPGRVNREETH